MGSFPSSLKKVSRFVLATLALSLVVDAIGFAFGLFYAGVFYDNFAHFLTTFALVALLAELYFRRELANHAVRLRVTARHALIVGAALGLAGGSAWEGFEVLLNLAFPDKIYNPPVDSLVDTVFGTLGGAFAVWRTVARFDLVPAGRGLTPGEDRTTQN